jgi:hypothetical protein
MTGIQHLSYSSVSTYLACPRAWRYRYLDRVSVPTSPELVFGSAVHGAVEAFICGQGELLPLWAEHWARCTADAQVAWGAGLADTHFREGQRILGDVQIQNALNTIMPGRDGEGPLVERKVRLNVPSVPIEVIGYIDVIDVNGVPCDLKTSNKPWTPERAQTEQQPLFYLAGLNQAGIATPGFRFRHIVITKVKAPEVQMLEHQHTPAELFQLFKTIETVWHGIEAGAFPPNPDSWRCSPRFCEFWALCQGICD